MLQLRPNCECCDRDLPPEGVTPAMLDEIFAPLPEGEEWTPFPA